MGTKTSHKGFTLIELIVVIVILFILGSVVMSGLRGCDGLEPEQHTVTVVNTYQEYDEFTESTNFYVATNLGEYTAHRRVWGQLKHNTTYNVWATPHLLGSGYTITSATEVQNAGQ